MRDRRWDRRREIDMVLTLAPLIGKPSLSKPCPATLEVMSKTSG
jgi:hypothetical protein